MDMSDRCGCAIIEIAQPIVSQILIPKHPYCISHLAKFSRCMCESNREIHGRVSKHHGNPVRMLEGGRGWDRADESSDAALVIGTVWISHVQPPHRNRFHLVGRCCVNPPPNERHDQRPAGNYICRLLIDPILCPLCSALIDTPGIKLVLLTLWSHRLLIIR